jgi:hypothetical protein
VHLGLDTGVISAIRINAGQPNNDLGNGGICVLEVDLL